MGAPATTRMVIPSDLARIPEVQDAILAKARDAGFNKDTQFAIRLALDEAVSNAIRHGNQNDVAKTVTIDFTVTPDRVTVKITDQGPGFDPGSLPDPTAPENLTRPHGRGVLLIQSYMTDVSYSDKGRCVTMTKDADCKKPHA